MKKAKPHIDSIAILILLLATCLFIVFLAFRSFFNFKNIEMTELKQVKGTIDQSYLPGGKSKNLVIKLREYPENFYVSSVQLRALNYDDFEANELSGSAISLSISREDFIKLLINSNSQNKKILVYSVSSDNRGYLDIEGYNESERTNVRAAFVIGCIFTVIGALILFFVTSKSDRMSITRFTYEGKLT